MRALFRTSAEPFSPVGGRPRAARPAGRPYRRAARRLLALLLCALLLCAGGCSLRIGAQKSVTGTEFKLDTTVTITLYDWSDTGTLERAMDEIDRLEALLAVEREGSDLFRLAQAAGTGAVTPIALETREVLQRALYYAQLSGGLFDVTVGPLVDLWNIRNGAGHYPTDAEREAAMALSGWQDLILTDEGAYLTRPGMKVNLGAIAKGYIADRLGALLRGEGVEHALIDLGHNILLIGTKPDGSDFRVGVQDPFSASGETVAALRVSGKSLVTSGTYERWFEYCGVRWHHVLDPTTGFPSDSGLVSATILCASSMDGDALSTTCLLLGAQDALALIESLPDTEALLVTEQGELLASAGLQDIAAQQRAD